MSADVVEKSTRFGIAYAASNVPGDNKRPHNSDPTGAISCILAYYTSIRRPMNLPLVETVPVEIWEKIFSYATTSSLLPFTENGKIASSLIDTIDLFSNSCSTFQRYYYDTLVTVQRLRLVCRTWAALLRHAVNGIAYGDFWEFYSPFQCLFGDATYLWVGNMDNCQCQGCNGALKEDALCLRTQFIERIQGNTHRFRQILPFQLWFPHLKVLSWRVDWCRSIDFPIQQLGNLMALSVRPGDMASSFSLKELFSSAPHLSHLHFSLIAGTGTHVLSEKVECPSLSHLSLNLYLGDAYKQAEFLPWSFPRLRTFVIDGLFHMEQQADLEKFLSRHGNSIVELEVRDFRYRTNRQSLSYTYVNPIRPQLWDICPNIRVIGMNRKMTGVLMNSASAEGAQFVGIPQLTLIVRGNYLLRDEDLATLALVKEWLNVGEIIFTETWEKLDTNGKTERKTVDVRVDEHVKELLEKLVEMEIPILDKYGIPVSHFLQYLLDSSKEE
jgi:hypothetical protein